MMKIQRLIPVALCAIFSAAAVSAQSGAVIFEELDTDHNGEISQKEAKEHGELSKSFTQADKSGDGSLSVDEFTAFMNRGQMVPEEREIPEPGAAPAPSY